LSIYEIFKLVHADQRRAKTHANRPTHLPAEACMVSPCGIIWPHCLLSWLFTQHEIFHLRFILMLHY